MCGDILPLQGKVRQDLTVDDRNEIVVRTAEDSAARERQQISDGRQELAATNEPSTTDGARSRPMTATWVRKGTTISPGFPRTRGHFGESPHAFKVSTRATHPLGPGRNRKTAPRLFTDCRCICRSGKAIGRARVPWTLGCNACQARHIIAGFCNEDVQQLVADRNQSSSFHFTSERRHLLF